MKLFGWNVPLTGAINFQIPPQPKRYLAPSQVPGGAVGGLSAGPNGNPLGAINAPGFDREIQDNAIAQGGINQPTGVERGEQVNVGKKPVYDGPSMAPMFGLGAPDLHYPFDAYETVFDQVIHGDLNIRDLQQDILERKLDLWAGIEFPYINPDTLLKEKHKNLLFYDVMMMDDRIHSIIELKKRVILAVAHSIVPASDSDEDVMIAEDIKKQLHTMRLGEISLPLKDVMDNFLDAKYYGLKCAEKVFYFDEEKKKICLRAIKHRHSLFFDPVYDVFKNVRGMWIGRYYGGHIQVVDQAFAEKFMLYVHPYAKDGNAYGQSDLMQIYPQFRAKQKIFNFRNERLESFGRPIPSAVFDQKAMQPDEVAGLQAQLEQFQNRKFFMVPGTMSKDGKLEGKVRIELLESNVGKGGSATGDAWNQAIDQIDTAIARKLLVPDKLGMSESEGGSYALGKTQFDLFLSEIERSHDKLEDLFNMGLIKQMVDYNYKVSAYPRLEFDKITRRIESQMLKILIDERVVDPRERWIRAHVGIPEIARLEKEELQKTPPPPPLGGAQPQAATSLKRKKQPCIDLKRIEAHYNNNEEEFIAMYRSTHKEIAESLLKAIERKKIIEDKDLEAARNLKINKGEIKSLMQAYLAKMYILGKTDAISEITPRLKALRIKVALKVKMAEIDDELNWLDKTWVDRFLKEFGDLGVLTSDDIEYLKQFRDMGFQVAGDMEDRLIKGIYHALVEGFQADLMGSEIVNQIKDFLDTDRERFATTIARTNASTAYNSGRMNLFTSDAVSDNIEAYEYSAIMDDATTEFCSDHNGEIIRADDPELGRVTPPNHFNCRSILIPIFAGDNDLDGGSYEGWEKNADEDQWERNSQPAEGFGARPGADA